jgi:hypothetical protein
MILQELDKQVPLMDEIDSKVSSCYFHNACFDIIPMVEIVSGLHEHAGG